MKIFRIAICDDDEFIHDEFREYIKKYKGGTGIEIIVEYFLSGGRFIQKLKSGVMYDLIFLDIEIDTITGIDIGNKIRDELDNHICRIVFISSKDGYEQQLFNIQPFNFFRKPIKKDVIYNCLDLVIKLLNIQEPYFTYKKGSNINRVMYKDILYFEKVKRKIKIVMFKKYDFFNGTISQLIEVIPNNYVKSHGS
ncbi:MAG: LytR/AlgR family response regulator transcription factor [Lachnospirales bacterium]